MLAPFLFVLLSGHATIVDGDTLHLGGERVRLWGIDAPELSTREGVEAKEYLKGILEGNDLTCQGVDTDKYGRTVSVCYIEGVDIACHMVQQGYAKDWPRFSNGYYAKCER